jgi:signal transduction histidine kinase
MKRVEALFEKWRKTSINQINVIAILFAGIFAFSSAFVIIFNELQDFKKEVVTLEIDYMQNQQRRAVEQTSRLYKLIEYRYEELKDKPKSILYATISKEIKILLDDSTDGNYIFVYDAHRQVIYESKYINPSHKVITDLIQTGKLGGGFLSFESKKEDKKITHLAFAKEFKPAHWIVGSGVSIDEIDRVLMQKKEEHSKKISGFILKIITLTLFLYIASTLKYRYVTEKITKETQFIRDSFKRASTSYTFIDRDKIKFEEFREITAHANLMIAAIKEKKIALENLNYNLESLIEEKTQELQKSLAYGKELLEDQDRFVKNAIHEINTPLSIILMNIDLYNLKYDKNPYLVKIEAGVKVLQNVYGDLSFVVKKDRADYAVEMINMTEFVKERVDYFDDVALGNRLTIKSEIEDEIFILFNEHELQRICDNNLSNAIKYSYINETIYVGLHMKNGCTVLEIQSSGDQIISPENLFKRYYREDIARGGFGLGLNIVKEICDKNSVKIEVTSDNHQNTFRYFFECSRK